MTKNSKKEKEVLFTIGDLRKREVDYVCEVAEWTTETGCDCEPILCVDTDCVCRVILLRNITNFLRSEITAK